MAIIQQNSEPFRPYARLMTMLGDQLITDKKVAIIELIKNSYDADANNVTVSFKNLGNFNMPTESIDRISCIEIRDDGVGMTLNTILNDWLRPATPNKLKAKRNHKKTNLGRIIQGEKGIGRFAIHKLGSKIEVITKASNNDEIKLEMDFSDYDPESAHLFNQGESFKLLEEVKNNWYVTSPPENITEGTGTIIKIYNLREGWSENDLKELYRNVSRLTPPIETANDNNNTNIQNDFVVKLYKDGNLVQAEDNVTFKDVIERAQFRITGDVDVNGKLNFYYKSTNPYRELTRSLNLFSNDETEKLDYDLHDKNKIKEFKELKCGPFSFAFYAFDLAKPDKTILNADLKRFIKENFVYVLRDGIRVYPYGEKGIDWLNLDKLRSTYRAGQFISYNDLTGFVYITQENNPNLIDSTNRQGLINQNGAYDEFTTIVTAITEIFNTEIKIDKQKKEIQKSKRFKSSLDIYNQSFEALKQRLLNVNDKESLEKANSFLKASLAHYHLIEDRMRTVEDLAGLGMAVEKSSHDSLQILSLMKTNLLHLHTSVRNGEISELDLLQNIDDMVEKVGLVYENLQIIQPLFKIQRQSIKDVGIGECVQKVFRYFNYDLKDVKAEITPDSSDFSIRTNVGLILQIFINLIDNSIYWLNTVNPLEGRKIFIKTNPSDYTCIVADNGPGVREDIANLIFEEFISMKSSGRGLGLYIVRDLLGRIDGEISLIMNPNDKILPGANFLIKFNPNINKK